MWMGTTPKTDLVMTRLLLFGYQQCQTGILKHEFLTEIEAPRDTTVYCSITTLIPLNANTIIAANRFQKYMYCIGPNNCVPCSIAYGPRKML